MEIPSLQKTSTSEPMSEISSKYTCMRISVLVADSRTATKFSSHGEPLYLNSVGPLFNGEVTLEVSLNEYGINDLEAKKYFSSHMSPTSIMSSSLSLQETITYSAEKAAYVLDKVEDTNSYLGVTAELARKPLGNISQLSCGDHDFDEYQSSFNSHYLHDNKISPAKLTS